MFGKKGIRQKAIRQKAILVIGEKKEMSKVLTKTTPVVFHYRKKGNPSKGGAITVVYNPPTRSFGMAVCGRKDNFCRKTGIKIATGRAVVNPALSWTEINNMKQFSDISFDDVKQTANELARYFDGVYHKGIFV